MLTAVAISLLQSSTLDLAAASKIIHGLVLRLQVLRTYEEFRRVCVAVEEKADKAGIDIPTTVPCQT